MNAITGMIVDDNRNYCKELETYFCKNAGFQILASAFSGEEALEKLCEFTPDVLILDMMMPQLDGMSVLNTMRVKKLAENALVFANGSYYLDPYVINRAQDLGVFYFFNEHEAPEALFRKVCDQMILRKRLFESNPALTLRSEDWEDRFNRCITNYLLGLGFRVHLDGYECTKLAIRYCFDHYGTKCRIVKDVYPYVARILGTTPKCVERNIRTCIETAWQHGNMDAHYRFFGQSINEKSGRPTNKEFIACLTDRMVARMKRGN